MRAIRKNEYIIQYVSYKLQKDEEVIFAALKQSGHNLKFTPKHTDIDTSVARIAKAYQNKYEACRIVSISKLTLKLLQEHQDNKDVVLAAVLQNKLALEYASKRLKANKNIILTSLHQNLDAIKFVPNKLKQKHRYLWTTGIWNKNL